MWLASILFFVLVLISCSRDASHGFDQSSLQRAVANKEAFDLAKFTSFPWDAMYVFPPYTPETDIKAEVGSAVPFPHSDSGAYCLLVFVAQGKALASVEVARNIADFSGVYRKEGYKVAEVKFVVEEDATGWKKVRRK